MKPIKVHTHHKPLKHPRNYAFAVCTLIGLLVLIRLWPDGDGWTRTGCIMVAVGAGLLGWTRPWEYNSRP